MRKLFLACALFAFLPLQGANAGEAKLSANQLRGLAPGAYEVAVMDVVSLSVRLYSNGRITGDAGGQHDTGQWHIAGDRLCIAWSQMAGRANEMFGPDQPEWRLGWRWPDDQTHLIHN